MQEGIRNTSVHRECRVEMELSVDNLIQRIKKGEVEMYTFRFG